ncbi:MAG: EEP domain-containing protein [Gammaproteobacteria bacterium]|nr:MAG: EEP domain-containing protein [Gammaproteobacteria bacterium]
MSFNIQTGIDAQRYRHYLTRSWRHVLPSARRQQNLAAITELIKGFDIVALQEVDAGSLRSGFINQLQYMAEVGQFAYSHQRINRDLGHLARQSIGLLSRYPILNVTSHKLPGRIPGRGAIEATIQISNLAEPLTVIVAHLSLGRRARWHQLEFLARRVIEHPLVCLMGDLNTPREELVLWAKELNLSVAHDSHFLGTYPSWAPQFHIDHILVSGALPIRRTEFIDVQLSDHLPVAVHVGLPSKHTVDRRNQEGVPHDEHTSAGNP